MHIFSAENYEMCQISQVIISIFKVVVGLNLTIFEGKKFLHVYQTEGILRILISQ
jgi:hypothetical protein